jgi:signal peptidase I
VTGGSPADDGAGRETPVPGDPAPGDRGSADRGSGDRGSGDLGSGRAAPDRYRGLQALRDNLEAFTIALVMALVIKHFCVEAFKIPTSSMEPTLHGHDVGGDRILVDKWAYLTQGPERGDVVVFRYPLNLSKHFIKRVAGVGPEWFTIVDGDLWTRASPAAPWRLARKRRDVRESLYMPVYPPGDAEREEDALARARELERLWDAEDGWEILGHGDFRFRGGEAAALTFRRPIGSGNEADARFRLQLTAWDDAIVALEWRTRTGRRVALRFASPGVERDSLLEVTREGYRTEAKLFPVLTPRRTVSIELECVDGEAIAHVNGQVVARLDELRRLEDATVFLEAEPRFRIVAEGGAVEVRGLAIDRDVWYTQDGMATLDPEGDGIWIPEGHYFMLGDNSAASSDSRKWTRKRVTLRNGRVFHYDTTQHGVRVDRDEQGWKTVVDVEGIERRWRPEDEDEEAREPQENRPLVHRSLVVGRAFLVFWPILPRFPGRVGFIH